MPNETLELPEEKRPWEEIEVNESNDTLWEAFMEAHKLPAGGDRLRAQKRFAELASQQYPGYNTLQVYAAYFKASGLRY